MLAVSKSVRLVLLGWRDVWYSKDFSVITTVHYATVKFHFYNILAMADLTIALDPPFNFILHDVITVLFYYI